VVAACRRVTGHSDSVAKVRRFQAPTQRLRSVGHSVATRQAPSSIDVAVTLGNARPLRLERPVTLASGPLGFGAEVADLVDLRTVGLFVTRGVSLAARRSGGVPRMVEVPGGLLHAVGRENPGIDAVMERHGGAWRGAPCAVALSLVAASPDEMTRLLRRAERRADALGISAYEIDLTAPADTLGGQRWERDDDAALGLIVAASDATNRPLIVKVSPQVVDIERLADQVGDAGADIISVSGSTIGFLPDRTRRRAALAAGFGELSGPLLRPLALAAVAAASLGPRGGGPSIVGGGGIGSPADALDFFAAGALAVSVGSAIWADPGLTGAIVEGARRAAASRGLTAISELSGSALATRSRRATLAR